ncbi:endonuclease NucS domain-containing protein [Acidisoma sp. C75]
MLEAALRDLLAIHISVLGTDLEIAKVEQYLPSNIGTRSFVDILAKDGRGRWVLIELKRSGASSREAIHEIYKYVEAIKGHLGARDDEVRAIIVSTEWKELLVPFSRFSYDTSISVTGVKLLVDESSGTLSAEMVEPLPVNAGRVLSPWHEISLYLSESRMAEGIASYDASCKAKGITDYVMVQLRSAPDLYEREVYATAHNLNLIRDNRREPTQEDLADVAGRMTRFDHMIYFVPQLQSAGEYLRIIAADPEAYEAAKDFFERMEGDELLCSLQEYALYATPRVDRDYVEIGYPAKFKNKIIETEGWTVECLHRRGSFARNLALSDDIILGEIAGEAGTSGQRLKRSISLADRADVSQIMKDVKECLPNNPVWVSMIRTQLEEAKDDFPEGMADVSVFAPSTGILTLLFATTKDDGVLYVPSYGLSVYVDGNPVRIYVGELVSGGSEPRSPTIFRDILKRYYGGDIGSLVMSMTRGGYETRDIEILDDLGLVYSSFRCDIAGEERRFFRVTNGRWRAAKATMPFALFNEYLGLNKDLLRTIFFKLSPRIGPMCDGSSANLRLGDVVDEECVRRGRYYGDFSEKCDLCLIPLAEETFISDGRVDGQAAWANMCADCTLYHGVGIGWGTGQLYRRESDGRLLLVAGESPDDDDDDDDDDE